MELHEALQTIGLNEKQAAVYTALLQLGKGTAYAVAEKSGLKKPTAYVILDELLKKGLVDRVPRARTQLYVPRSPEQAFAVAEEKIKVAKQKLPELLALAKGSGSKVNVMYFEGVSGLQDLVEYRIREMRGKELVGFYATDPKTSPELSEYFRTKWSAGMKELGIPMRGIVPDDPSLAAYRKADASFRREVKIVPRTAYSSDVAIDVIGDLVRIQDYKNLQGVLLENADVAKTVREIFELVWGEKK